MKRSALFLALCFGLSTNAFAADKVSVTIVNKSSFEFHNMYLSPTSTNEWGPDQLGDNVINPGESFTLNDIPVNAYDFKMIDEDGDDCIASDVKLNASETVEFDDADLVGCQVATAEEEDEADDEA
ncbi:MAG: hypothetical protein RL417_311 [Pseudomonadota bacterium]|jgi:hypothetical protein